MKSLYSTPKHLHSSDKTAVISRPANSQVPRAFRLGSHSQLLKDQGLQPRGLLLALVFGSLSLAAIAQTPAATQTQTPTSAPAPTEPPPPHGTVLFERHAITESPNPDRPAVAAPAPLTDDEKLSGNALSDDERAAPTITAWDLDARITPSVSALEMHARVTLRNDGKAPLTRIALQISSSLTWQSATLLTQGDKLTRTVLPLVQHHIETDADHTGSSSEAVLSLPTPLAPGQSLTLDTLYAGNIPANADRLRALGATAEQALNTDWDAISATASNSSSTAPSTNLMEVALRGFGNVLWYPVASPQLFLGDGNKLFATVGANRLREQTATVHLRLSLDYHGDPPVAAYFCGRRQPLKTISDNSDAPVASGTGIATADFPAAPLGFRPLSLFTIAHAEALVAPLSHTTGKDSEDLLAVETDDNASLPRLADSALSLAPLAQQWFGPHPLSALTILDHDGQPFEDGPLLIAPISALSGSNAEPALLHSLTHAWVQSGQPWMDEGLAQFMSLVYTGEKQGHDAADTAVADLLRPVAIAEPDPETLHTSTASGLPPGQPLIAAQDEIYYRRKAAAAWWALRSFAGDDALQLALATWRTQPTHGAPREQALAFEVVLEKTSHKDLAWFFDDWVLNDRGLPDLTIAEVTPRVLAPGQGKDRGWIVAVTVRNDGAAATDVPLTVLADKLSVVRQIHIAGLSSTTERVIIAAPPTQVLLNDGSIPELRSTQHTTTVTPQQQ